MTKPFQGVSRSGGDYRATLGAQDLHCSGHVPTAKQEQQTPPKERLQKVNQHKGCSGLTWQHRVISSAFKQQDSELKLSLKVWEMTIHPSGVWRRFQGMKRCWSVISKKMKLLQEARGSIGGL